jgi:hypothetical protein
MVYRKLMESLGQLRSRRHKAIQMQPEVQKRELMVMTIAWRKKQNSLVSLTLTVQMRILVVI